MRSFFWLYYQLFPFHTPFKLTLFSNRPGTSTLNNFLSLVSTTISFLLSPFNPCPFYTYIMSARYATILSGSLASAPPALVLSEPIILWTAYASIAVGSLLRDGIVTAMDGRMVFLGALSGCFVRTMPEDVVEAFPGVEVTVLQLMVGFLVFVYFQKPEKALDFGLGSGMVTSRTLMDEFMEVYK